MTPEPSFSVPPDRAFAQASCENSIRLVNSTLQSRQHRRGFAKWDTLRSI
jgi:hypothetical protein